MKIWARIAAGVVVELLDLADTVIPGQNLFTADFAKTLVAADATVQLGWIENADGTLSAPAPVAPALATVQAQRLAVLEAACAAAILGGYSSSALGSAHLYGSKITDQLNLSDDMVAAATNSTVTAQIDCSADNGVTWAPQAHTAAQIGTLAGDFRTFRIAQQTKLRTLEAEVAAATTAAAVAAIAWA